MSSAKTEETKKRQRKEKVAIGTQCVWSSSESRLYFRCHLRGRAACLYMIYVSVFCTLCSKSELIRMSDELEAVNATHTRYSNQFLCASRTARTLHNYDGTNDATTLIDEKEKERKKEGILGKAVNHSVAMRVTLQIR